MKTRLYLPVMLASLLYSVECAALEITIAYENKEQFPYYLGNSEMVPEQQPGVAVEVVQRLVKYIPDIRIHLIRCPWGRCLNSLSQGNVDGVFNASYKKDRTEIGVYPWAGDQVDTSRRMTTIAYSFYKLEGSPFQWDGKQVSHLNGTVGAPLGYSIVEDLRTMGLQVDESRWTRNDFGKMQLGRVAVVAAQEVTGDSLLMKSPGEFHNIVKVNPPISTKPYYLMLSHQFVAKHPQLAERIWDTIRHIRESELLDIAGKY